MGGIIRPPARSVESKARHKPKSPAINCVLSHSLGNSVWCDWYERPKRTVNAERIRRDGGAPAQGPGPATAPWERQRAASIFWRIPPGATDGGGILAEFSGAGPTDGRGVRVACTSSGGRVGAGHGGFYGPDSATAAEAEPVSGDRDQSTECP